MKYTSDKRKNVENRRAKLALSGIYKEKKKSSNGPDEFYGLAEPLLDVLPEQEFELKKNEFIESITLTESSREILERETKNQTNNQRWLIERRNRLTASNFGRICKMRPHTSCKSTVFDLLYGSTTSSAMEYGKNTEEIALKALEAMIGKQIRKCGLFVDKNIPYLAATPG